METHSRKHGTGRISAGLGAVWRFGLWACLLAGSAGCAGGRVERVGVRPYAPENFIAMSDPLPGDLRRAAVLPLAVGGALGNDPHLAEAYDEILASALRRSGAFQVYRLSEFETARLAGRPRLGPSGPLPKDFFERASAEYRCDAVLFSELTDYHPFPPVRVGWHMKLVTTDTLETVWEIDEIFDAGEVAVAIAAERHYAKNLGSGFRRPDRAVALSAPRLFSRYALAAALETLPEREIFANGRAQPAQAGAVQTPEKAN